MDPAVAIEVASMSRQRALEMTIASEDSDIMKFYKNCTFFLTGGSGFMGKQIIEKLFRSCQPAKVFVLLRPKKGVDIQERMNVIFQDPVFGPLRKQQPDFEEKIVAVPGDVAEVGLGIRPEEWETLTNQVEIIYHVAATTRFDETLRTATMINVRGTREAIHLAKACKKLKSYVHVSTAYSHATQSLIKQEVYETFYPSPIPPQVLISMAEDVDVERLNDMKDSLIKGWPNTYTFTKAVAEDLVRAMTDGLPVCIVRPGVVVAAYREPLPGWIDLSCIYGASGLLLGLILGIIHTSLSDTNTKSGLVPCDYVNNVIISAGKEAAVSSGGENTKIYFVSSNLRHPITYGLIEKTLNNARTLATPSAVYYIFSFVTNNMTKFTLLSWFLHTIPAYVVDFVCLLIGKERRFVKLTRKMYKLFTTMSYFSLNDWMFVDKNLEELYSNMSKTDQIIFNCDLTDINWTEYVPIWGIGLRKYIIKDGLKDNDYALKKQFWLKILNYIVFSIYLYCLWKVFSVVFYTLSGILSLYSSLAC